MNAEADILNQLRLMNEKFDQLTGKGKPKEKKKSVNDYVREIQKSHFKKQCK